MGGCGRILGGAARRAVRREVTRSREDVAKLVVVLDWAESAKSDMALDDRRDQHLLTNEVLVTCTIGLTTRRKRPITCACAQAPGKFCRVGKVGSGGLGCLVCDALILGVDGRLHPLVGRAEHIAADEPNAR